MIVKGWNPFYEGWLAFVFNQPFDETQSQSWQDAWKMAEETGADFITIDVIQAEIEKGHIIVEPDSQPRQKERFQNDWYIRNARRNTLLDTTQMQ